MSTRSAIIMQRPDGKYVGIYCHSDGYPAGVGKILRDHYTDPAKVAALIELGDLSSLGQHVAPPEGVPHSYAKPADGVTVAYHRDRGDEWRPAAEGLTAQSVYAQIYHRYAYIFWNGVWWCVYDEWSGDVFAELSRREG